MLNKLAAMMRQYDMVQPGDTVVCAVSGGADSVALLLALYLLRDKLGIELRAAHFNHRLRREESDGDEAFVRDLCARYEIPLFVGSSSVVSGKKGLEAAAREARYAFFETLPGKIATAHTADDNAETVLMHMVRGTGLKGLGGIAPVRGKLIRPMLLVTREQVLSFLEEYHLQHVEDSSNKTDAFLRNRLRHRVMPLLTQENPKLALNLSNMALRLREDEAALQVDVNFSKGLLLADLEGQPKAQRSRILAAFLQHCGVKEPEAEHIALAQALCLSDNPSARAAFPGDVTVCRRYDRLVRMDAQSPIPCTQLENPGVTEIPELGIRVVCTPAQEIKNSEDTFTVLPAGTVFLRCRAPADTMTLPGGSKSLKKLFIDRKIPAADRPRIPVLADDAGVLGVPGIGINCSRAAKELPALQIHVETINSGKEPR